MAFPGVFSLVGRTALVTGAGSGIGAAVAQAYAAATGRILNVTCAAGLTVTIGQANYGAAKAGIIGLTTSLARELARRQITVSVLAPLAVERRDVELGLVTMCCGGGLGTGTLVQRVG